MAMSMGCESLEDMEHFDWFNYDPGSSGDAPVFEKTKDTVSPLHKCITQNARKLCILDVAKKLKHSGDYDIGGTYAISQKSVNEDAAAVPPMTSEFWFLYKTSFCPSNNYLLNLYVCHRTQGNFAIAICDPYQLVHKRSRDHTGTSMLSGNFSWRSFKSIVKDEFYHVKTFCFNEKDIKDMDNRKLYIPILIKTNITNTINYNVVNKIKMNHNFAGLLYKEDTKDLKLETQNGKVFNVHKIVLAAHSPILRDLIKNPETTTIKIDHITDEDMSLLLEFIYTGTIKNIMKNDCNSLIGIANRFKLRNLFVLTQHVLSKKIEINNALDIALMSEEYNLEKLQEDVFAFIKKNPKVLESDGWKNLDNVNLMKKLFLYIYST